VLDRMTAVRAALGDVAQRVLTLNKLEQRRYLLEWLRQLNACRGATVLDLGCGTGLFASTLNGAGLQYRGYDPDLAAVRYARRMYPHLTFVSELQEAMAGAPYDFVLANCCFHHVSDDELRKTTLPAIAECMRRDSVFLLVDVLPQETHASMIRRLYNAFEEGETKRTPSELEHLLADRFVVRSRRIRRSFAFSLHVGANPIYNDLIMYELVLA
jgi:2-polyprenyl-3-methyl-5-hydroxy-6-metoxy-1,4-benzoquinol methylase